jgi:ketosteroid isomerase-like protein
VNTPRRALSLFAASLLAVVSATSAADPLADEIARMDDRLSVAFNAHDIAALRVLFTDDLEFYQDNEGLGRYEQTMRDFESMFAQDNGMKRTLEPEGLEVVELRDYGAVQFGRHRFCHEEDGKEICGSFRFVHVWRKLDGDWKIARVISFGH